ncbi:CrcB family protein [Naasia sp. SYSU D00948]|uniref:fluoride efflux transporter FluC n=1 Tax=Naasia sp. SYSU D00948 TaxID=2817379 RepID=UPI001B301CA9|nr:CrcB family protein [Naasia sp. SYSU D00948]
MLTVLVVGVAGALGAVGRFVLDTALRALLPVRYPIGTLVVNVSGSLLLGLLAGLAAGGAVPESWRDVAGAGFLGGFTTFSTAAVEAVRLAHLRRFPAAALASVGMLLLCAAAAAAGLLTGRLLTGGG